MMMIDNQVIENFFKSLQNAERDFLIFESFENLMGKTPMTEAHNNNNKDNSNQAVKRTSQNKELSKVLEALEYNLVDKAL
jgi:hypothetical protein